MSAAPNARPLASATRDVPHEPLMAQIAGFVDLLVWLLVLKAFFIPLFIIPTGSMAETLRGEHGVVTCSNCAYEYQVGFDKSQFADRYCPNCHFLGDQPRRVPRRAGDRIVVHGWNYDFGGSFGPERWDVVVFKNPNNPQENYIKRLIGLPNETIELIAGDVWVTDDAGTRVARKTRHAQQALWFPYFDQNFLPRSRLHYNPRWLPLGPDSGWTGLESRAFEFDGLDHDYGAVQFVNESHGGGICVITDVYGYDGPPTGPSRKGGLYHPTIVTDVRISADCAITTGTGYVELLLNKWEAIFRARFYLDGRVTLEQGDIRRGAIGFAPIAEARTRPLHAPARLSLGHADLQVVVEVDNRPVIATTEAQYTVEPDSARARSHRSEGSFVRIGAERIRARLTNIRIDRDVHYTDMTDDQGRLLRGNGVQDHPIELGPDQFYVLGDNSPRSGDSRYWRAQDLGPHLQADYRAGKYRIGTVPRDQLIGRAFLVYWPGFMPLPPLGVPLLPDLGRVRWIH